MKIFLLFPRGFCAGVNRATAALSAALKKYAPPVYVYHEIVHNKWVVEYFRQRGAVFIDDITTVPNGSVLLFSAHGVSPQVEAQAKAKGLKYIDAACPLVKKVHSEARRFVEAEYKVILIGHPRHDEVVGVQGEAADKIFVVDSPASIDKLLFTSEDKVAYITQTTLSVEEAANTIEYLKAKFPGIACPAAKDICYATQNRQRAIQDGLQTIKNRLGEDTPSLVKAIIVGSANSSNSIRLTEIARNQGCEAYLIDGAEDIQPGDFQSDDVILLSAGASAHETLVQEVVEYFRKRFNAKVEEIRLCEENTVFQLPELPD